MPKNRMSDDEFARIWNSSSTPKEAADKSGYSVHYVRNKAKALIDAGWGIKRMTLRGKIQRAALTDKEFIRAWNNASGLEEIAALSQNSKRAATVRASRLRSAGFELKYMPQGMPEFAPWAQAYLDAGCTIRREADTEGPAYVAIDQDGILVDWWRLK